MVRGIGTGRRAHPVIMIVESQINGFARYPGLHCDVESYVYLPLLEDTGYMPRQKYISGAEIRSYLVSLAKQYGLEDQIMYRTEVNGLQWSDDERAWKVDMTVGRGQGGRERSHLWANAEFVFFATGLFPMPQAPKLPGLSGFQGSMFHTARWDYEATGGSSEEPFPALEKLKGKRVGIIGTGATAIQVVPQVAKYASDLYVFQRTPSAVSVRNQKDTDPEEWRDKIAAKKGWHVHRMENFAIHLAKGAPDDHENLVGDAVCNFCYSFLFRSFMNSMYFPMWCYSVARLGKRSKMLTCLQPSGPPQMLNAC